MITTRDLVVQGLQEYIGKTIVFHSNNSKYTLDVKVIVKDEHDHTSMIVVTDTVGVTIDTDDLQFEVHKDEESLGKEMSKLEKLQSVYDVLRNKNPLSANNLLNGTHLLLVLDKTEYKVYIKDGKVTTFRLV